MSWKYGTNLVMVIVAEQMWLSSDGSLALQVMALKTFFQLPIVEIVHENSEGKVDIYIYMQSLNNVVYG